MPEPFALAIPPEWDPTDTLIDLGDGTAIPERVRVRFVWEGRLVTLHLLAGHSDEDDGDPVIVEQLDVRDQRPPGVLAQALRQMPWKAMKQAAIDRCRLTPAGPPAMASPRGAPPTRRASLTPRHLALVAKVYAQAVANGAATTRAVQEQGPYPCSPHTAVKWIWTARREGMLTATSPGQRGGQLTAKARRLLEEDD